MDTSFVGDLAFPDVPQGSVYVLRSRINCRFDGDVDLLHVISKFARGEIRGYKRGHGTDGAWLLRYPCYTGDWPEMDAAVAALLHAPVKGFHGAEVTP